MKGLMKNLNPHFHKAIPTEEDCRRIKAQEAYYRPRLDKILGEHFLKLFKMIFKGDKMQEIMKDESEGKTFVEDTIEDLLPHIKKSLSDPNVKYVKVFRAKKLFAGLRAKVEEEFVAEEQRTSPLDELIEKFEEGDKKNKEEEQEKKKTSRLYYPIGVLVAERDNIHGLPKKRFDELNGAIDILNEARYRLVKQEFKVEAEKKKRGKSSITPIGNQAGKDDTFFKSKNMAFGYGAGTKIKK